jgi:hypothetical protein
MDAMAATFAPGVELPSPLLGSVVFKGAADVKTVLSAVYASLGKVEWEAPIGSGRELVAIAHTTIAGMRIDDAMHFELDDEGRIVRIRPHLRPLLATIVFALLIGPRILPHPGVVLRGLRRG